MSFAHSLTSFVKDNPQCQEGVGSNIHGQGVNDSDPHGREVIDSNP